MGNFLKSVICILFSLYALGTYGQEMLQESSQVYESCLKGVEEGLKNKTKDLDALAAMHLNAKKACHCMAYDPEILKAAQTLADHQAKGNKKPFELSDEYQALLAKTQKRCFTKKEKAQQ